MKTIQQRPMNTLAGMLDPTQAPTTCRLTQDTNSDQHQSLPGSNLPANLKQARALRPAALGFQLPDDREEEKEK